MNLFDPTYWGYSSFHRSVHDDESLRAVKHQILFSLYDYLEQTVNCLS